jgi:hypothetical protein
MDLAQRYLDRRAPGLLAYGRIHNDHAEDHLHMHLLLSANQVGESTRYRIEKETFNEIRRELEDYCLEHYPHLEQERLHHSPAREPIDQREFELIRRKGTSKRMDLMRELDAAVRTSTNARDLALLLRRQGIDAYFRGEGITIVREGFKARLQTLGLGRHHGILSQSVLLMNQIKERLHDLERTREAAGYFHDREDALERVLQREYPEEPPTPHEFPKEPSRVLPGPSMPHLDLALPEPKIPPGKWHLLVEPGHLALYDRTLDTFIAYRSTASDPDDDALLPEILGLLTEAIERLPVPSTLTTYQLSQDLAKQITLWIDTHHLKIRHRARLTGQRKQIPDSLKDSYTVND